MRPKISFHLISNLLLFVFLLNTTAVSAQSQNINFDKLIHDFGDFLLTSGPKSYTFNFTNSGDKPLLIQTVISSCGCASPQWTKTPVAPGKRGSVTVTFLNNQGPYPFDKALTVYVTGEQRPIVLRIKGVVHEKEKSLDELFPSKFGSLSLKKGFFDFGHISKGRLYSETVEGINNSKSPIKIEFTSSLKGISIEANPSTIPPNGRSSITIKIEPNQLSQWGKITSYAKVLVGGKEVSNRLFPVSATLIENFEHLTAKEREMAPIPMAQKSNHNFGTVKRGQKVEFSFDINNIGKSEFQIRAIYSESGSLTFRSPSTIAPSKSGRVEVTFDSSKERAGNISLLLSIIGNSPIRPVMNLIIQGTVTP
ncbi:MAG: DUF1573 domain-containing protein [Bacteroidales bacterium]